MLQRYIGGRISKMKDDSKENLKLNRQEKIELFSTIVLVLGVVICYQNS